MLCDLLLTACAAPQRALDAPSQQSVIDSTVNGKVTYTQKVALLHSAVVTEGLHDQTSQKAVPGAGQSPKTESQQVPIAFELPFNPTTFSKAIFGHR